MSPGVERFRGLVARDPGNELFRFSLAQALAAAGAETEAAEHYEACVRKKADWMMPRILLGKLRMKSGRRAEAKTLFEEALRLAVEQHHEDPEREVRTLLAELAG